jgi:hypothetical protein
MGPHYTPTKSGPRRARMNLAGDYEKRAASRLEPFSVPIKSERGSRCCFDAFSSREPLSTPDQVRGRLSLENALAG